MRLLVPVVIAALCLTGLALAEPADAPVRCDIEDGVYVIRIPDPEGDLGWLADDMAQDDSVVKLADEALEGDEYVVRYAPAGDGEVTVAVRHYIGIACDRMYTWDLTVKDGVVQENTGGSFTAAPDEAELDPYFSGEWLEEETQFTQLTVAKGEDRGWDVEAVAPLTHGAYVFKTTVYYDCDLNAFVYDKGKFWDVPITDSEDAPELGEAKVAGTTGSFTLDGDADALALTWYDDVRPEETVVFARADSGDAEDTEAWESDYTYFPESEEYVGLWRSGDWELEIVHMTDDYNLFNCIVTHYTGEHEGVRWIYDACSYDDVGMALSSLEIGMKFNIVLDDDKELVSNEQIYDDGAASFALNADGTLTWTDYKETPGEDQRVFEKVDDPGEGA